MGGCIQNIIEHIQQIVFSRKVWHNREITFIMVEKKNKHELDIPTRPFSGQALEWSLWYVNHKIFLRRVFIVILIFFNSVLFIFSLWRITKFFILEPDFFAQISRSILSPQVDFVSYFSKIAPKPILIFDVVTLSKSGDTFDLLARVKNPNPTWYAKSLEYQFEINGEGLEIQKTYLLPEEERYLIQFRVPENFSLRDVRLRVKKVEWKRLAFYKIWDYSSYAKLRKHFRIDEVEYVSSRELGALGETPVSRIRFRVKNESTYNFWNVGFVILLHANQKILGANHIASGIFLSDETKNFDESWFGKLPLGITVEIYPEVDILDPNAFMDFQSMAGEKK